MKKYPKYKPSGVEWVGDVPEGWEVKKLKFLASVRPSNIDKKTVEGDVEAFLCNYVDVYKNNKITKGIDFMKATATAAQFEQFRLKKGDVLATKDSEDPADIAVPALVVEDFENVVCGYHLTQITPNATKLNGSFLFWTFKSQPFNCYFEIEAKGVTRYALSIAAFEGALIFHPPLPEQTAIAAYLDRKTAQIDQAIAEKERLIELFREERQAIINHAVTKGIRPGAKMKDSGVEWIGEVPEGWAVKKLKYLGKIKYGLGQPPPQKEDGVPLIRATNVERGKIVEKDLICVDPNEVPYERDPVLKANDIIIVRSGAYTADSAIIPPKFEGAITGYDMVFRAEKCEPKYIAFALLSHSVLEVQLLPQTLRAAQPHLNREELGETVFVLPADRREQVAIVAYIDQKITEIDTAISGIRQEITLLQEYRQALIFEAVTGKIDVREAGNT